MLTDDLTMGAIASQYPLEEAAVQAVRAGADLVMVCHGPETIRRSMGPWPKPSEGTLPREQVDAALYRILRTKEACSRGKYGILVGKARENRRS